MHPWRREGTSPGCDSRVEQPEADALSRFRGNRNPRILDERIGEQTQRVDREHNIETCAESKLLDQRSGEEQHDCLENAGNEERHPEHGLLGTKIVEEPEEERLNVSGDHPSDEHHDVRYDEIEVAEDNADCFCHSVGGRRLRGLLVEVDGEASHEKETKESDERIEVGIIRSVLGEGDHDETGRQRKRPECYRAPQSLLTKFAVLVAKVHIHKPIKKVEDRTECRLADEEENKESD